MANEGAQQQARTSGKLACDSDSKLAHRGR